MTIPIQKPQESYYTAASNEEFAAQMSQAIQNVYPIGHSQANYGISYTNIQPNTSSKVPFGWSDYNYFRPNEAIPKLYPDILKVCQQAYDNVPLVKQIIDLMGDFGTKGIRIVHPNPQIQKYYEDWWKVIEGKSVSERILNCFYRLGVVYIREFTVKLTEKQNENLFRTQGADLDYEPISRPEKNEIPLKYTLYSPLSVRVLGAELAAFSNKRVYLLKIPDSLKSAIAGARGNEAILLKGLPQEVLTAIRTGKDIVIPEDKFSVYYYKKDDWALWAYPMIYPILSDLVTLDKMKLADRAALDGVISKVRVWKLGDLDNQIVAGDPAMNKFASMLQNNTGGGPVDIVWNPAIELLETATTVDNILGEAKYIPSLNSIYSGLGVPQTLTGNSSGGFTNNATSLKTLIERLQYGRDMLIHFWSQELKKIQLAKGFRFPAEIVFDRIILTDETTEKGLYLQLADRNIISYETIRERFGELPVLEARRVKREETDRFNGKMPTQTGPYAYLENDLKKIALTGDMATPSEVGLELEDSSPEDKALQTKRYQKFKKPPAPKIAGKKPKGRAGQGRPSGKKDSTKRKTKTVKPRTGKSIASISVWATQAQKDIAEILNPIFFKVYDKKNLRQFTEAQSDEYEDVKFAALANLEPFAQITQEIVGEAVSHTISSSLIEIKEKQINSFQTSAGRKPNIDEVRNIQSIAYAIWFER